MLGKEYRPLPLENAKDSNTYEYDKTLDEVDNLLLLAVKAGFHGGVVRLLLGQGVNMRTQGDPH